jgi:hypothetical protein
MYFTFQGCLVVTVRMSNLGLCDTAVCILLRHRHLYQGLCERVSDMCAPNFNTCMAGMHVSANASVFCYLKVKVWIMFASYKCSSCSRN